MGGPACCIGGVATQADKTTPIKTVLARILVFIFCLLQRSALPIMGLTCGIVEKTTGGLTKLILKSGGTASSASCCYTAGAVRSACRREYQVVAYRAQCRLIASFIAALV